MGLEVDISILSIGEVAPSEIGPKVMCGQNKYVEL